MMFILNWLITSFLNGLFFFLLFLFMLYWFYLKELPVQPPPIHNQFEEFTLNAAIRDMISASNKDNENGSKRTDYDCVIALNMIFQFLFQELKDTKAVRRYIIRKMTMEFKELLNSKGAGKFVQRISARDFSLGTSFPIIHSLKMQSHQMDKAQKSIQELSVIVDLEYKNGFSISVDVDLILGRSAYVHIKIASIKGKARLQFTRHPFTHWSFAFIEEPLIEFAATSQFDGRQIPQLTTLILNQLRRSIRRKHTLPNYKVRFKPFFDPVYNQSLYKTFIDEILSKTSANKKADAESTTPSDARSPLNLSNDSNASSNSADNSSSSIQLLKEKLDENLNTEQKKTSNERPESKLKLNLNSSYNKSVVTSIQYRKLCDKLGYDLTSVGQLVVSLKLCDRLPESLYSLNMQTALQSQTANPQSAFPNTAQLPKSNSNQMLAQLEDKCSIFITLSVDSLSMKSLMEKQICKEHWPLIELELTRENINQSLGLSYVEIFFINKTEIAVQKVFPNSLASSVDFKPYDIIFSLNQVRITSIKQLNKSIQKAGINAKLKFVVQRPCIIMSNKIKTSALYRKSASPTIDDTSPTNALSIDTTVQGLDSGAPQLVTPNSQTSAQVSTPSSLVPMNLISSSSLVSSTILSTKSRLEQKFKLFGNAAKQTPSSDSESGSVGAQQTKTPSGETAPKSDNANSVKLGPNSIHQSSSANNLQSSTTTPNPAPKQVLQPPQIPLVTHTASASCLVDYFCSVSECATSEQLPSLDLIKLLANPELEAMLLAENGVQTNDETKPAEPSAENKQRAQYFFKKTRDIKVEKDNLFSFNNSPIPIDETYTFDLNPSTNYLNIFLWTVQYTNKMTKMKNLLIGYITLPLNEINVDCWHTSKGESQSVLFFKPIEELKASAISKLTRSHVISDHPGFDSNLSVGALVVNFQHKIETTKEQLTNSIADELISQNNLETELSAQITDSQTNGGLAEIDDGSIHKFVNVTFNDMVVCEFCNKKIWFKNAYRCAYCGYIIHIKCYEKTIGKTICGRFFSKTGGGQNKTSTETQEEQFVEVGLATEQPNRRSVSPSQFSLMSQSSEASTGSRNLVSNFFSGIRQRRVNKAAQETQGSSFTNTLSSKTNTFLNSISIGLANRGKTAAINEAKTSTDKKLDDSVDVDDFKDIDPSEEKFFGIELFDELPLDERKGKFEEMIQKYQSTIEMMTKLKSDLDKELADALKAKQTSKTSKADDRKSQVLANQQEEQLKSQIKHLEDQIKCVVFLLMQCQIGLENCNDTLMTRNGQFGLVEAAGGANEIVIPEINVDQIEADSEFKSDEN